MAEALRDWLPLVINAVQPWMSSEDIAAGSRWNSEVAKTLEQSRVGIFCITRENLESPWLHFEAGAIAKDSSQSHACLLLLGVSPIQVKWPLAQFQAKDTSKQSVFEMLRAINSSDTGEILLREEHLRRAFDKWWPELEERIGAIPASPTASVPSQTRTPEDLLSEILILLRRQQRLSEIDKPFDKRLTTHRTKETIQHEQETLLFSVLQQEMRHFPRYGLVGVRIVGEIIEVSLVSFTGKMHEIALSFPPGTPLEQTRFEFGALVNAWVESEASPSLL